MLCKKCGLEKSDNDFQWRDKKLNRKNSSCKACCKIYSDNHYLNNKEYYLAKADRNRVKSRDRFIIFIQDYLSIHPCIDCGETDPTVLEFDHINPEHKFKNIANMRHHSHTKVANETSKCEVRCANCHRRKTMKQFGWNKMHYYNADN